MNGGPVLRDVEIPFETVTITDRDAAALEATQVPKGLIRCAVIAFRVGEPVTETSLQIGAREELQ